MYPHLCYYLEDPFFVHFRENIGGDVSASKTMQFYFFDAIIETLRRIFYRDYLNWMIQVLLLNQFFPLIHEYNNSR